MQIKTPTVPLILSGREMQNFFPHSYKIYYKAFFTDSMLKNVERRKFSWKIKKRNLLLKDGGFGL